MAFVKLIFVALLSLNLSSGFGSDSKDEQCYDLTARCKQNCVSNNIHPVTCIECCYLAHNICLHSNITDTEIVSNFKGCFDRNDMLSSNKSFRLDQNKSDNPTILNPIDYLACVESSSLNNTLDIKLDVNKHTRNIKIGSKIIMKKQEYLNLNESGKCFKASFVIVSDLDIIKINKYDTYILIKAILGPKVPLSSNVRRLLDETPTSLPTPSPTWMPTSAPTPAPTDAPVLAEFVESMDILSDTVFPETGDNVKCVYVPTEKNILCIGGSWGSRSVRTLDLDTYSFTSKTSISEQVWGPNEIIYYDNKVYFIGSYIDKLYVYDIISEETSRINFSFAFENNWGSITLENNNIWLSSGETKQIITYNIDMQIWTQKSDTNIHHDRGELVYVNNKIYILGTQTGNAFRESYIEYYNDELDIWNNSKASTSLPRKYRQFAAVPFRNQYIYLFGGLTPESDVELSKNIYLFDTISDSVELLSFQLPYVVGYLACTYENYKQQIWCFNGRGETTRYNNIIVSNMDLSHDQSVTNNQNNNKKSNNKIVIIVVSITIFFVVLLVVFGIKYYLNYRRKYKTLTPQTNNKSDEASVSKHSSDESKDEMSQV